MKTALLIIDIQNDYFENGAMPLYGATKAAENAELVICGMMTHVCIDSTVRAAKDFGYNITLIGDACATKDLQIGEKTIPSEEVHYSFLAALNYFYASVETTKEYFENL
jgi:nicotinamidase-related amidase